MGTSFDTVWSPTINVFLLIMRLFLEAGGISPHVLLPQMGSSIVLVAFRGLLLPGPAQLLAPSASSGKHSEPQFAQAPHSSDSQSLVLLFLLFLNVLTPGDLHGCPRLGQVPLVLDANGCMLLCIGKKPLHGIPYSRPISQESGPTAVQGWEVLTWVWE